MTLTSHPPFEQWDSWTELDPQAWPKKVGREHMIVPTLCFNCEAGCGLLAYVDKEDLSVRKIEGNPLHPGSRGKTCAKGPATLNQITDPERILYPLKRAGKRGEGKWEQVSWESVLEDIGGRIRKAIQEERHDEVMYHVGRPGEDGFMNRLLQAWGVDGHNSHTNVCSASTRLGFMSMWGSDRSSPDYANAEFVLLVSAKLESGHYFNPHAQRLTEARESGTEIAVLDIRLSNTASIADHWLPTHPGTEAEVLLSIAGYLLREGLANEPFIERWTNWRATLPHLRERIQGDEALAESLPEGTGAGEEFSDFLALMSHYYTQRYPFSRAAKSSGVPAELIETVAKKVGKAGEKLATHIWRNAASGNLGGWQIARALLFLNVLTGSVGCEGGTAPHDWHKMKPPTPKGAPPHERWNTLLWPPEYPLSHYEMSFLLPHLLLDGRGEIDVYFTRVFNPVWTYPDGANWIEALSDESKIKLHIALTPTWNETAQFADYVLPMGHSPERHDHQSQETHMGRWIGLRQPVLREAMRRLGKSCKDTKEANPGEVWEEAEFFLKLSWVIDPEGELGIRQHFEATDRPGEPMTVDDFYRETFRAVPGLEAAAEKEGLDPLEFMRRRGAFAVEQDGERLNLHEKEVGADEPGVEIGGVRRAGFKTPSRRLEIWSQMLADWGWPEHALPDHIDSQIAASKRKDDEIVLVPTFRLPVLIHSRSGNAKWLLEIAHSNPLWLNPADAEKFGLSMGDLARVSTRIGSFVLRVWITEGIRPGVVACSHHLGRWRKDNSEATNRWSASPVSFNERGSELLVRRVTEGLEPFESGDPDSQRLWWEETGVHQNMTFPVQPDPMSGMHCWHQVVRVQAAGPDDQEGDVRVDRELGRQVYREWLETTRPGPGPGNLRRPLWLKRPIRPTDAAYQAPAAEAPAEPAAESGAED